MSTRARAKRLALLARAGKARVLAREAAHAEASSFAAQASSATREAERRWREACDADLAGSTVDALAARSAYVTTLRAAIAQAQVRQNEAEQAAVTTSTRLREARLEHERIVKVRDRLTALEAERALREEAKRADAHALRLFSGGSDDGNDDPGDCGTGRERRDHARIASGSARGAR